MSRDSCTTTTTTPTSTSTPPPWSSSSPSRRYIFDKDSLVLPSWLKSITPKAALTALHEVREAATIAFNGLKALELKHSARHKAMCPTTHPLQHALHADSVDRLINWATDMKPHNPTLAPAPKLSPYVLQFHVDQRAYDAFVEEYTRCLEEYVMGPYADWLRAKANLDDVVERSDMNELNLHQWRRWWEGEFLGEMAKWEERLEELVLPSWEEIVDEMYRLILERVDDAVVALGGGFGVGSGLDGLEVVENQARL